MKIAVWIIAGLLMAMPITAQLLNKFETVKVITLDDGTTLTKISADDFAIERPDGTTGTLKLSSLQIQYDQFLAGKQALLKQADEMDAMKCDEQTIAMAKQFMFGTSDSSSVRDTTAIDNSINELNVLITKLKAA